MKTMRKTSERSKLRQSQGLDLIEADLGDSEDTQVVTALARGLALLDAFRRDDVSLGNAELAERTGLTKPTVSRLAYTLARNNYLLFDQERREYCLGVGAIALGAVALAMTNIRMLALPLMRQLAIGSRFNVGLGTRAGHQMIYTDACEGDALIALRLFPGSRIPIAMSAMGRAYLASVPASERDQILAEIEPRYDAEWPSVRGGIQAAAEELDRHGYCSSLGDWQKDIHGIAVPIANSPGQPVYVLNLGGPAYALPEQDLRDRLAPRLLEVARAVEIALGLTQSVSAISGTAPDSEAAS